MREEAQTATRSWQGLLPTVTRLTRGVYIDSDEEHHEAYPLVGNTYDPRLIRPTR